MQASPDCALVGFAEFFVHRKSLRIEVLLAPDAFRHGIDQENNGKGKTDAPDPPAHAGTSTLENGSLCGGLDSFFSRSTQVTWQERVDLRGQIALLSFFPTTMSSAPSEMLAALVERMRGWDEPDDRSVPLPCNYWQLTKIPLQRLRSTRDLPGRCTMDPTHYQPFYGSPWCHVCGITWRR